MSELFPLDHVSVNLSWVGHILVHEFSHETTHIRNTLSLTMKYSVYIHIQSEEAEMVYV